MSLAAFQRAIVDMAASPALCAAVMDDAAAALAGYDLTEREIGRLASAAASKGMVVNCMLYRANRLAPLSSQLRYTFHLLGMELRATAEAYWAVNPRLEPNATVEVRRFAQFVRDRARAGDIREPLVPEVLEWEMTVYELALLPAGRVAEETEARQLRASPYGALRLHPLIGISRFSYEPGALLGALFAKRRPPYDDVPAGDHYLLVDARSGERLFYPLTPEGARSLLAVRDGLPLAPEAAEGLIAEGLAVEA